jgi:hypothetical protein
MEVIVVSWKNLEHAYGSAENIPALLAQLASFPAEASHEQEPWFSLWSSLCHQGDIYSASFAAVPEIIKHLASAPQRATFSFFALPASIEIARAKDDPAIPAELSAAYFESIRALAPLAASLAHSGSSPLVCRAATAAFAAAVGQHGYAELVLEVPPEDIHEVFEWYWER